MFRRKPVGKEMKASMKERKKKNREDNKGEKNEKNEMKQSNQRWEGKGWREMMKGITK